MQTKRKDLEAWRLTGSASPLRGVGRGARGGGQGHSSVLWAPRNHRRACGRQGNFHCILLVDPEDPEELLRSKSCFAEQLGRVRAKRRQEQEGGDRRGGRGGSAGSPGCLPGAHWRSATCTGEHGGIGLGKRQLLRRKWARWVWGPCLAAQGPLDPGPHEPRQGAVRGPGHLASSPQSSTSRSGACLQAPRLCRVFPQLEGASPVFLESAPEAMGEEREAWTGLWLLPSSLAVLGAFASINCWGSFPVKQLPLCLTHPGLGGHHGCQELGPFLSSTSTAWDRRTKAGDTCTHNPAPSAW